MLFSAVLHFKLYKNCSSNPGNTLLVIGGIHGNEPGGYYSASFLVRYYDIKKGCLWVVPNLNFDSIIKFKRGVYGDMNRKFAYVSPKDRDYKIVKDIQKIITNPKVDLILNLHDGHGFYRDSWQNSIFNPAAWGQTCIIDQEKIKSGKFGNLGEIARAVSGVLNKKLTKNYHIFNVKNTKTKFKDEQMRLSLTYFAITHNKPAFAIETSKNIKDLPTKIYYQLSAIEEFMKIMGINYVRKFDLNVKTIKKLLNEDGYVYINKTLLPLKNLRSVIKYFPLQKSLTYKSDDPLVAVLKQGKGYVLYEGFHKLTTIYPQYFKNYCKIESIKAVIDGVEKEIKIPSTVNVKKTIKILGNKRVNVIGYAYKGNEANIDIDVKKIQKRYSVDRSGKIFRVEIYDGKNFCGMFLIKIGSGK